MLQTLRSNQQMAEAMRGATKAMSSMNRKMNLPRIQQIMMEFEKESELMDMKDEMMGDAIDDVVEEEDDEVESEEIVNKVLDEIGISLNQEVPLLLSFFFDYSVTHSFNDLQLAETPTGIKQAAPMASSQRVAEAEGLSADDAALQARLDNLRRE